ncbi:MAG TPA: hypothetical protein VNL16_16940 [Chloroflexota bacterium]|nr:hypothetical protein [Chloroflexota bacterium]
MGWSSILARLTSAGPFAVFLLFLVPWNPAGPAPAIVLARKDGVSPLVTVGLYVLSDVVTAIVLEPFVRRIRGAADRSAFGRLFLDQIRRLGAMTETTSGPIGFPLSLVSLSLVGGEVLGDILSVGLPISRALAWFCMILGDTLGFLILFLASLGIAAFLTDNRVYFVVTLLLGFALPPLIRRLFGQGQPSDQAPR